MLRVDRNRRQNRTIVRSHSLARGCIVAHQFLNAYTLEALKCTFLIILGSTMNDPYSDSGCLDTEITFIADGSETEPASDGHPYHATWHPHKAAR